MASDTERIKEKLPIEEVIGAYVKLEKSGGRLRGKCPFHNERTPSFFVSPERGSYYCFGCGVKGDIFTFTQEFEGLDFRGALKSLASRAGIELSHSFDPKEKEDKSEKEAIFEILEMSTLFYQKQLALNIKAIDYLKNRGLSINAIKEWRLGLAPDSWNSLRDALLKKGFNSILMRKAGLTKPSEKNPKDEYDRFRNRIMFPLFDISGRVVGFSGRYLGDDKDTAKYLNSPETAVFDKSSFLYGFDRAKLAIRNKEEVVLVEGQMDLIMSHQAGVNNVVAVSGTALSEKHVEILRRFSKSVILAFDSDKAGEKASERAWQMALSKGLDVKVCQVVGGKDPADLVKEDPKLWHEALKNTIHIIDLKINKYVNVKKTGTKDSEKLGRKIIEDEILPYVAVLESPLESRHFLNRLSIESGLDMKTLEKALEGISVTKEITTEDVKESVLNKIKSERIDLIERRVASLYVWKGGDDLKKRISDAAGPRAEMVFNLAKEDKDTLLFEAEASFADAKDLNAEISDLIRSLEEESLKKQLSGAMIMLKRYEADKNSGKVEELLGLCHELSRRLHSLKSNI